MKYTIYRLKDNESAEPLRFMGSSFLKKSGWWPIEPSNYEQIWEGTHHGTENTNILEWVYAKFNIDKPKLFHHYSLSVGDIVVLIDKNKPRAYFCDTFGWTDITAYFKEVDA